MIFQNYIKAIIRIINNLRLRKSQYPQIKILLKSAKDNKIYMKYPLKKHPPIAMRYPQWKNSDRLWLDFYYSVYQQPDEGFMSVPLYYYIETCLNHRMLTYAIKEKNFYNKFLSKVPTPDTIVRKINGFYYNSCFQKIDIHEALHYLKKYDKLILKPSVESGGGSSIKLFCRDKNILKSGNSQLDNNFFNSYTKDFVLQEFVIQQNFFKQFNPNSNNTIRVFIYRSIKDDSINILHCLLRIGAKGSFLDHDHLGGVVISIKDQNTLGTHAIDLYGNKYSNVNSIDLKTNYTVPFMREIREMAIAIAENIYYGRILALDFTVNREGKPLLFEINCWRNGIDQYQMHNGSLFKGFTEEILDYCQTFEPKYFISF